MNSKVELYVFRHGETDWNRVHRFQGHTDIPLNENGIDQAVKLSSYVEEIQPQIILTSDLSRAKNTALIVNKNIQTKMIETPMLRECRLGDPEGMLRSEIDKKYGKDAWKKWNSIHKSDQDFSFPNGESKREHLQRQLNFLETFMLENSNLTKLAVSTHGGSLRRLVHYCDNSPTQPIPIPNCALYKIEFNTSSKTWLYHGPIYLDIDEIAFM